MGARPDAGPPPPPPEGPEALDALSLGPLWTALHVLLPNERVTAAVPHRWRWQDLRPLLLEAARLVPIEQAERRVLVLKNPGLDGAYAVTSTLFAGLQIILPGEAAPSHHHTPAALPPVEGGPGLPEVGWPWAPGRRPLPSMADGAPGGAPVALAYVNPGTGAPPLPTMGCECQWLRPGETTPAARRTASAVYHVLEGRGESRIGDARLAWEAGDTFVAPPWHFVEHRNAAPSAPAALFQFNDEPALRALGLYCEEARV